MSTRGFQVLDLEAMANHKGSVLGSMPNDPQPSQKLFESRLYGQLQHFDQNLPIWLEGEGSKIGAISVPMELIQKLRNAQTILLDVPKSERVKFILEDYSYVMKDKKELQATLSKLAKFVGNDLVAQMHALVEEGRWESLIELLLEKHYDPLSKKFLETRLTDLRATIHVPTLASDSIDHLIEQIKLFNS
jgi:tRNA 2-selenouridine synthase